MQHHLTGNPSIGHAGSFTIFGLSSDPLRCRLPSQVQAADLAAKPLSLLQQVEFLRANPALLFETLGGTIKKDEKPLPSSQARPIHVVAPERLDATVPHRLLPFLAMMGDDSVLVSNDAMAGLVDHRFPPLLFRGSRPERDAQSNSGSEGDGAVKAIPKPSSETAVPLDDDGLGQFFGVVPLASEPNPFLDVRLAHVVV